MPDHGASVPDWPIVLLIVLLVYSIVYYVRWLRTPDELKLGQHKYRRPRRHNHEHDDRS